MGTINIPTFSVMRTPQVVMLCKGSQLLVVVVQVIDSTNLEGLESYECLYMHENGFSL
jgi:hypothetical protein